ncbi:cellulose synthase subunit BcsC [bacterium BMS3Abin14]|nr:cellulose synthase subunit BcsC [bacterium BMS3Abin14]
MASKEKLLQQAQKLLSKGSLDKAVKVFQQLVDLEPQNQRSVLRLAELLAKTGRKAAAVEQYEKVAEIHVKEDFIPKAIAVYRTVVRIDPERLSAYERLAELYKKQGLEAEALAQLQNIFELYSKSGDVPRQTEVLRVMVDMDSENLGFQVRLGEILAKSGNRKEAAKAFAAAATTLSRRGFHDRASELFEKIVALDPDNIGIREELCSHFLESGHYKEAKNEIESILKIRPDDPRMILLLGRINFQLGEDGKAEECVSRSLSLFRETGQLEQVMGEYLFVAQTHLRNGELKQAEIFFRQIIEVDPEQSIAVRGLADVFGAGGDTDSQVKALFDLGHSLEGMEDFRGAAEAYRQILDVAPQMGEARTALENLGSLEDEADLQDIIQPLGLADEVSPANLDDGGSEFDVEPLSLDGFEDLVEAGGVEADEFSQPEVVEFEIDAELETEFQAEPDAAPGAEPEIEGLPGELEEELPEIVIEDIDPVSEPASESPSPDSMPAPPESRDLVPEDTLIEADVYLRYGLHDKALDILADLETRFPGRIDVLEKLLEVQMEVAPERVPATTGNLIEALTDQGDLDKADSVYRRIAQAFPDLEGLEEVAGLLREASAEVPSEAPIDDVQPEPLDGSSESDAQLAEDPFADDMEEADFYISQGLEEDAERVYTAILEKSPDHQGAFQALANLKGQAIEMEAPQKPGSAKPHPDVSPDTVPTRGKLTIEDSVPEAGGFLDLAAELRSELADEFDEPAPAVGDQDGPITFEEIFAEFKKGIADTLGAEEYETHYNLGIAYKDMGLFDDAIGELETATGDPALLTDSMCLIAMCFVEKQDYDSAAKTIDKALESSPEKSVPGLTFQMGQIREQQEMWDSALDAYEKVKNLDPDFDDIDKTIERAGKRCGNDLKGKSAEDALQEGGLDDLLCDLIKEVEGMAQEETEGAPSDSDRGSSPNVKKNRVSYL